MDRHALLCRCVLEKPMITQREIATEMNLSLGTVNTLLKECIENQLIAPVQSKEQTYHVTDIGMDYLGQYQVDGALIIAAGFGSRFVPLTFETPKGLLSVFGERMIERQIRQLHEAGILDITIVVGYLKEKFEYLIDKYQIELIYNPEYSTKNTIATIQRARHILNGRNMYVLSSDNWMRENMFHQYECGSWYSASYMEGETSEWVLSYNKKGRITDIHVGGKDSWVMYGPVFFSRQFSSEFLPILDKYYRTPGTEQWYWENVLMTHIHDFYMDINRQPENQVYEFENLEELRLFDSRYENHSNNETMELVSSILQVKESQIQNIRCLKSGMTNKSFLFQVENQHYICRIPGTGSEYLVNRQEEASVYEAIKPLDISEHVIYLNSQTGHKISHYYEGARNSDAHNPEDVCACMKTLRQLHHSGLRVNHVFDFRKKADLYEQLCNSHGQIPFEDYSQVRQWMNELLDELESLNRPMTLSHIDSNADNFLVLPDKSIRLIDWEYAGMCDPLVDISMYAIYSYYKEDDLSRLMEIYFERPATDQEQRIIYTYVALGGFIWSLWAVYKSLRGEEFGDYTLIMYRYAKNYYRKIRQM